MLKRVLEYLLPYKSRIIAIVIVSLLLSVITLMDAWLMGRLTDAIFYRTKGFPITLSVGIGKKELFTLNLVKKNAWTKTEQNNLQQMVNKNGLTYLSGIVKDNSLEIEVSVPKELAGDPLKLIDDLQTRLSPEFKGIRIYLSAGFKQEKTNTGFLLLPQFYTIYILPFALIIVYLLRGLFRYTQGYMVGSIGQKIVMQLRNQIYENLQNLSIGYFEKNKIGQTGQLISRITGDISSINFLFTSGIFDMILQPMVVIFGLVWGFVLNWKITLMAFLVFPFVVFPIDRLTRKLRMVNKEIMNKMADITDVLEETLSGIKVVKAFGMEKYEVKRFQRETKSSYRAAMDGLRVGKMFLPTIEFTISIALAIFIIYSGNLILHNTLNPSEFFTFVFLMATITNPIRSLSGVYSHIPRALVAAERVFEIIDQKSEVIEAINPIDTNIKGKVEFEKVSFGYTPETIVLKNISLEVQPGEVVALVGPSGAGKTTLVNLVARFYDPLAGVIKIDGYDLTKIKLSSLRKAMGIVPQETVLFRGTIAENIAYGKIDASMEEIITAAKASNADEFIRQMPDGYETRVGSRGATLSGGQRQRIAIARALLRDPRILILDEATSALDTQSEILVQEALQRLMKDRTSFVIAHRLSTIRSANRIVVMQKGEIVEVGTHEELLYLNGLYAMLYKTQFRSQDQ